MRSVVIWCLFTLSIGLPIALATTSPFLAYRQPIYVTADFSGVMGLALLVTQPLLAMGVLPGLKRPAGRRVHRWTGVALLMVVALHIIGLWITSPPDVIDVLLVRSPTPFSIWGLAAMWALAVAAALVIFRRRLRLRTSTWSGAHLLVVSIAVVGTVVHALRIEGTMETVSKTILGVLAVAATAFAWYTRFWKSP